MKLLKSKCGRAWLFDAKRESDILIVGFACFLAQCPMQITVSMGTENWEVMLPAKVIDSPVPVRIINARLSVLSESA